MIEYRISSKDWIKEKCIRMKISHVSSPLLPYLRILLLPYLRILLLPYLRILLLPYLRILWKEIRERKKSSTKCPLIRKCLWSAITLSFMEFSVIYWIRNNFPILCYLLLICSISFLLLLTLFFWIYLHTGCLEGKSVSEGLLFVSFFWTSFHSLSSPTLGISQREGFYLPDPCELNFANTILLSNAAISFGNAFISLEISSFHEKWYILESIIFQS